MTVITESSIRQLAGFRGEDAPVTSCYLDIDGRRHRRHQDYEGELDRLLQRARQKANGTESVHADFRRIEEYVRRGVDRSRVRGLALFSCSAHDFFEVVPLPVSVRSEVVVNRVPAVRQLEELVHQQERMAVLLADKQRARLFVYELGELVDHSETIDELPRDYDRRGERERGDTQQHNEALASQHLRHAASAAWEEFQRVGFERITVGAPEAMIGLLEAELHPYLRERLAPRIEVLPSADLDEIRSAVLDVEAQVERDREQALVERLRDADGRKHRAVVGLGPVLEALSDRRVERLLVSDRFSHAGWTCAGCDALATVGRACPRCGAAMQPLDDVVEEAVEEAIAQSCRVDVCVENADLDCLGRVGAFLRY